jgi:hypothetical protein
MNDAFGAHCNTVVHTRYEPMKRSEKLFCWVVSAIGLVAVVLMALGAV